MDAWLKKNLPLPAQVWWRDDLDSRLHGEVEIKRTFGLLRNIDGLMELLGLQTEGQDEHALIKAANKDPRVSALVKSLGMQYERDRTVKFKQADLKPKLLDVVIDIPAKYHGSSDLAAVFPGRRSAWSDSCHDDENWRGLLRQESLRAYAVRDHAGPPAAALFLREHPRLTRIVLEGAPGQGKSTIGQYLCQVHRARLLESGELNRFPAAHLATPIRIPFLVDLRDLALWLRKGDPFDIQNDGEPRGWHGSVEAFLAAQIREDSGGMDFTVTDLDAIVTASPVLLVMDGLDEVADPGDRRAVVTAVNDAYTRLAGNCPSVRVIVTSRPNAFSKSPGFSKKDYEYFSLADLSLDLVLRCTDGWLAAKAVEDKEALDIRRVLGEKLAQPHIIDLARNPMQLAILLWLIQRKGLSLPDKRTALYTAYMDTFMDREAEKTPGLSDLRELILELHGYIGWHLHCKAESGRSSGSISESRLKTLMKRYLADEKWETDIVDLLFTGMTQRVMVLTSRIEGTFEFEVQPLREFFAARYLYTTGRTSPVGAEQTGTRSDRFEALLRNPYWFNVARFFAGFSDKGELANLVDLIEALATDGDYMLAGYPRFIAATLLRDHVFTQRPRSAQRAMEIVAEASRINALAGPWFGSLDELAVGPESESAGVAALMRSHLEKTPRQERGSFQACRLLAANEAPAVTADWWFTRLGALNGLARQQWVRVGAGLGVIANLSQEQVDAVVAGAPEDPQTWELLLHSGRIDPAWLGDNRRHLMEFLRVSSMRGSGRFEYGPPTVLSFTAFSSFDFARGRMRHSVRYRRGGTPPAESFSTPDDAILQASLELSKLEIRGLGERNMLPFFQEAYDVIVGLVGEGPRSFSFAIGAGAVVRVAGAPRKVQDFLDKDVHPVLRARFARHHRPVVGRPGRPRHRCRRGVVPARRGPLPRRGRGHDRRLPQARQMAQSHGPVPDRHAVRTGNGLATHAADQRRSATRQPGRASAALPKGPCRRRDHGPTRCHRQMP